MPDSMSHMRDLPNAKTVFQDDEECSTGSDTAVRTLGQARQVRETIRCCSVHTSVFGRDLHCTFNHTRIETRSNPAPCVKKRVVTVSCVLAVIVVVIVIVNIEIIQIFIFPFEYSGLDSNTHNALLLRLLPTHSAVVERRCDSRMNWASPARRLPLGTLQDKLVASRPTLCNGCAPCMQK